MRRSLVEAPFRAARFGEAEGTAPRTQSRSGSRFHYFARGAVASHADFRIVRVGIPIQVCGLAIAPGDILHGDENGLLLVPREGMDRLATEVEAVRTRERALMEFVRGPDFTLEKLRNKFLE